MLEGRFISTIWFCYRRLVKSSFYHSYKGLHQKEETKHKFPHYDISLDLYRNKTNLAVGYMVLSPFLLESLHPFNIFDTAVKYVDS